VVLAVSRLHTPLLHTAEQVAFPHQAQYPLVIYSPPLALELPGDPPVAVARKLQADGFNVVYKVSFCFHLVRVSGFTPMVEGAPGHIHEPAPPPDTTDEVFPPPHDLPFL